MPYRPWLGRKIGIEFEMTRSRRGGSSLGERDIKDAVQAGLIEAGLNPRDRMSSESASWRHSDGSIWELKTDASCGWELTTPALHVNEAGTNDELETVMRHVNQLQPVVNRSCGTHVHFDLSDFNWREVQAALRVWARFEPFFYELIPYNRRENHYCSPIFRNKWDTNGIYVNGVGRDASLATNESQFRAHAQSLPRTSAFNVASWWRHRRVEIRLHSGTVSTTKITKWIMLMCAMFMRGKQPGLPPVAGVTSDTITNEPMDTRYVCRMLGLLPSRQIRETSPESDRLVEWIEARRQQFRDYATQQLRLNSTRYTGVFSRERPGCIANPGSSRIGALISETSRVICGNPAMARPLGVGALCEFHAHQLNQQHRFTQQCRAMPGIRFNYETRNGLIEIGDSAVCPHPAHPDSSIGCCRMHTEDHSNGRMFRETRSAPGRPLSEQLTMNQRCVVLMGAQSGPESVPGTRYVPREQVDRNEPSPNQCPNRREPGRRMCTEHLEDYDAGRIFRVISSALDAVQEHGPANAEPVGALETSED